MSCGICGLPHAQRECEGMGWDKRMNAFEQKFIQGDMDLVSFIDLHNEPPSGEEDDE